MANKRVTVALKPRQEKQLEYLVKDTGLKRTLLIQRFIEREYSEALAYPDYTPRLTAPVRGGRVERYVQISFSKEMYVKLQQAANTANVSINTWLTRLVRKDLKGFKMPKTRLGRGPKIEKEEA